MNTLSKKGFTMNINKEIFLSLLLLMGGAVAVLISDQLDHKKIGIFIFISGCIVSYLTFLLHQTKDFLSQADIKSNKSNENGKL